MATKVFFQSEPDFACNPRAIYEYIKNNPAYECVWAVRHEYTIDLLASYGVKSVIIGSEEALAAFLESDLIFTSYNFPFISYKKPNQIYVCTWHGFGVKTVALDRNSLIANTNEDHYKFLYMLCDMMISKSRLHQIQLGEMFNMDPLKLPVTGYPRQDLMFEGDAKQNLLSLFCEDERQQLQSSGTKLILYTPTMRVATIEQGEGAAFEDNIFNFADYDPKKLDEILEKNNCYILAKLHPKDFEFFTTGDFETPKRMFFIDGEAMDKNLLTIYHILPAFDALITDYSSIYTDFMVLDRPIIFNCPDMEKYSEDRGFFVDDPASVMPGEITTCQAEFEQAIINVAQGNDVEGDFRRRINPLFNKYSDNNNSKRVMDIIESRKSAQEYPDFSRGFGKLYNMHGTIAEHLYLQGLGQVYAFKPAGAEGLKYDTYDLGFEETQYLKWKIYGTAKSHVAFDFVVHAPFESLRFDPDNQAGFVISDFEASASGNALAAHPANARVEDGQWYFFDRDPQICIDCKVEAKYDEKGTAIEQEVVLHVEFDVQPMYGAIDGLLDRIDIIEHSRSWKVTKPLRKARRLAAHGR